jgi:hypothetical protein
MNSASAYFAAAAEIEVKLQFTLTPGANVIKLFTAVIYRHSMVIPSFCVIKHYYYGRYHRMAINYRGKKFL